MAETFTVEVVTPTSIRTFNEVGHVRASGVDGQFGVLPRHIPAIIGLKSGELRIDMEGEKKILAASGGYCEVQRDKILFLVETAELPEEIDIERAQNSLDRARERLKERQAGLDMNRALSAMNRAKNRLKIAGKK